MPNPPLPVAPLAVCPRPTWKLPFVLTTLNVALPLTVSDAPLTDAVFVLMMPTLNAPVIDSVLPAPMASVFADAPLVLEMFSAPAEESGR